MRFDKRERESIEKERRYKRGIRKREEREKMPALNSRQRLAVQQVMEFTGCGESVAKSILKSTNYDVAAANNIYLDQAQAQQAAQRSAGAPLDKSKPNLEKLFASYRTAQDDADEASIEGTMKYLTEDLEVGMEDPSSLVALEIIGSPAMGVMTKKQFVDGWVQAAISAGGKKPLDTTSAQKAFIASQVSQLASNPTLFKKVYKHTFFVAKEKAVKAVDLETACGLWGVLFSKQGMAWKTPGVDWLSLWIEYLGENWKKTVSKDMWNQTCEFAIKSKADPTLAWFTAEGAWPSVIDEFVDWYKQKSEKGDKMETD